MRCSVVAVAVVAFAAIACSSRGESAGKQCERIIAKVSKRSGTASKRPGMSLFKGLCTDKLSSADRACLLAADTRSAFQTCLRKADDPAVKLLISNARKARTDEAKKHLKNIYNSASKYFMDKPKPTSGGVDASPSQIFDTYKQIDRAYNKGKDAANKSPTPDVE